MPRLGYFSALLWGIYCICSSKSIYTINKGVFLPSSSLIRYSLLITSVYSIISFLFTRKILVTNNTQMDISIKSKYKLRFISLVIYPLSIISYILSTLYINESISASISSMYPIIIVCVLLITKHYTLNKLDIISVILAIIGSIILLMYSSNGDNNNLFLGFLLSFLSCICYAIESLLADSIVDIPSDTIVYYKFKYSIVPFLLIFLLLYDNNIFHGIIYHIIGAISMSYSYIYFYKSINTEGLLRATQSNISYPLFVIILQIMVGNSSPMNIHSLVGILFIFISMYLSYKNQNLLT